MHENCGSGNGWMYNELMMVNVSAIIVHDLMIMARGIPSWERALKKELEPRDGKGS